MTLITGNRTYKIGVERMINLILGEYLRNLKERDELDSIFLLLLEQMGFDLIKSAKSSLGQPEYGNDITALKTDSDGIKKVYIFQIKGGQDSDISASTFNKQDGIRESLFQAIDVDFKDSSLPGFNDLPKKIILVHNGELKSNFRNQFEGFIQKHFFHINIEFERWDIFKLTKYFSDYLFNEYLIIKQEYLNLFKKSLAFLDVPENDFSHFKKLVDGLFNDLKEFKPMRFKKLMATFRMIASMILHYSQETNNLEPSKNCLTYMLLKTWGWILKNGVENEKVVLQEFIKLNILHFKMLAEYFKKTIPIAIEADGLFSEKSGPFEAVGYPIRSMEYIGYFLYHIYHIQFYQQFIPMFEVLKINSPGSSKNNPDLSKNLLGTLKKIITKNSGCSRPLQDNHSIPIVLVLLFLIKNKELEFAKKYLVEVLHNIAIVKTTRDRLPELVNNIDSLIEFSATGQRPSSYEDKSSYLLKILFEFTVIFEDEQVYNNFWKYLSKDIALMTYIPPNDIVENEHILFQKELDEEGATETFHTAKYCFQQEELSFKDFSEIVKNYSTEKIDYRTDKVGLSHLRTLAHLYFKTPLFPDEWRFLLVDNSK